MTLARVRTVLVAAMVSAAGVVMAQSPAGSSAVGGRVMSEAVSYTHLTLTASKPAYLTSRYGAAPGSKLGVPMVLRAGESVRDLRMVLQRGAVITGVVRDAKGAPLARQGVILMQLKAGAGGRLWTRIKADSAAPDGERGEITDDRGRYRFYGLAPGEYRVAVALAGYKMPFGYHQTTAADIERARKLMAEPTATATAPATALPSLDDLMGSLPAPKPGGVQYAPVFYPGTTSLASATTISVRAGEERDGIDVRLEWTRVSTVEGVISGMVDDPQLPKRQVLIQALGSEPMAVSLKVGTQVPQAGQRFSLSGLAPGAYVVEAMYAAFGTPGSSSSTPAMYGSTDIVVSGNDASDVGIQLRPAFDAVGRVEVDGVPTAAKLTFTRDGVPTEAFSRVRTADAVNGAFTITNLPPSRYRITTDTRTLNGRPVRLDGVFLNGKDVTHEAVALEASPRDLVVKFSTTLATLAGEIRDAAGAPAPGYAVLAFPVDRRAWYWQSPAIQVQRLSTTADFDMRQLPAGEYYLAALTDVDGDEIYDPQFLAEAAGLSAQVRLTPGSVTRQNLQIGRLFACEASCAPSLRPGRPRR